MRPTTPPTGTFEGDWLAELEVDRSATTPAYLQLKHALEDLIASGRLAPGAALPPERALAERLGLARMTVRRTLEALVESGLVETRQGAGSFVRLPVLEQPVANLSSFTEEMSDAGFAVASSLLAVEQFPAGAVVARSLEVEPGTTILRLQRLRTLNGVPFELQDAYLPPRFLPLNIVQLTHSGSLYSSLEAQFGARPARAVQTVGARGATLSERKYLKLAKGVPVLLKKRVTYGLDGRAMELALCASRSDSFRLVFELG